MSLQVRGGKLMKKEEKIKLLVKLIETSVSLGYDISDLVGKPLSYFNFNKVATLIKVREEEIESI
jgi:hypothetical protein